MKTVTLNLVNGSSKDVKVLDSKIPEFLEDLRESGGVLGIDSEPLFVESYRIN